MSVELTTWLLCVRIVVLSATATADRGARTPCCPRPWKALPAFPPESVSDSFAVTFVGKPAPPDQMGCPDDSWKHEGLDSSTQALQQQAQRTVKGIIVNVGMIVCPDRCAGCIYWVGRARVNTSAHSLAGDTCTHAPWPLGRIDCRHPLGVLSARRVALTVQQQP